MTTPVSRTGATDRTDGPVSETTGHRWPCTRFYVNSSARDRCTCGATDREVEAAEDVAVQRLQALRLQFITTATAAISAADAMELLIHERRDFLQTLAEQPGGGR